MNKTNKYMTLRQYLIHLQSWLRMFPLPTDSNHLYTASVGSDNFTCLICQWKETFHDDDDDTTEKIC